jgi:hypothetical protein
MKPDFDKLKEIIDRLEWDHSEDNVSEVEEELLKWWCKASKEHRGYHDEEWEQMLQEIYKE